MTTSRRRLLLAGAASSLATTTVMTSPAHAAPVTTHFTPAPDLDITPTNDPTTNRANLIAALSDSAACVLFPPGDYRLDNTGSTLRIPNFTGRLHMHPGARFVFTDNTARGITFAGGSGARFSGLSTTFTERPGNREDARECVLFDKTTDTFLEHTRIDGSAAAGLLFWQCIRPTVFDAVITDTMADGLHFANCQDGRADHIVTDNTGDDGVAFINYVTVPRSDPPVEAPNHTGGLATNLLISRSRARGVCVGGQSGVTVRDAVIQDTASPGLLCEGKGGWNVRVPTGVSLERIRIVRGGAWRAGGATGKDVGVRVADASAVLREVTVEDSLAHGIHCWQATATLLDVTVKGVTGAPGAGIILQNGTYLVDRAVVENVTGIGLDINGCARAEYGTVTLRATAQTHHTRRAVNVENNALVFGERLWIEDAQPRVVGTYHPAPPGKEQRGTLGTIVDVTRNVVLDNRSKLTVTEVEPA
jgi:hypothetical protein